MATTKAKKRATKSVDDGIYWVVSQRSHLFTWTPVEVYKDRRSATLARERLESSSHLGIRAAKVDRVTLGETL